MKSSSFFSVVIPLHNKAPHIKRAIQSVFAQKGSDYELIIVDDASSDGGREIAEGLITGRPACRLCKRTEPGPGGYAARNLGIREAAGEWIAFLDADDQWAEGLLDEYRRLMALFPDSAFIGTAQREVSVSGKLSFDPFYQKTGKREPECINLLAYAHYGSQDCNPIHTSAVAVKKELLLDIGGFPEDRCVRGGDRDTWLRLLSCTDFAWSPFLGAVYYRDSVNMVTHTTPPPVRNCMDQTIETLIQDKMLLLRFGPAFVAEMRRLANAERKSALKHRLRKGALCPADVRMLYFSVQPSYWIRMLIVALIPGPLVRSFFRFVRFLKGNHNRSKKV
ncbi:glycosyltransferase family 2 protein [Sediminispirochaeta bajacaliforniensis]|uniref:glycosyltransferase family 2 protein n=1 Tax=Sediminispirochaeta bajacaliforniensis TaxID=148 RepID=UPI000379B7A1|nr:glycosyltransferase family A protein [Sediminispirochaeta bajacaliforniensis]